MRPSSCFTKRNSWLTQFGEVNENNELHGRGIRIDNDGDAIQIGYFKNRQLSTGKYIRIYSDGEFRVGEYYMKEGKKRDRYTKYCTDGKEEQYDW